MAWQVLWLAVLWLPATSTVELGNHLSAFWQNITSELTHLKEDLSAATVDLINDAIVVNYTLVEDIAKLRTELNATCTLEMKDHVSATWKNFTSDVTQLKKEVTGTYVTFTKNLADVNNTVLKDIATLRNEVHDARRTLDLKLSRLQKWSTDLTKNISDLFSGVVRLNNQTTSQDGLRQLLLQTSSVLKELQRSNLPRGCQSPFVMHGTSCYWFSKKSETQSVALTACQALGGSLVQVGDKAEDDFLNRQMFFHDISHAWIDVKKISITASKPKIIQSSGARQSFTNWAVKEPNNENEECVEILRLLTKSDCILHYKAIQENCDDNVSTGRRWNDESCTGKTKPFICEFPV